jgi:hypothetical protein
MKTLHLPEAESVGLGAPGGRYLCLADFPAGDLPDFDRAPLAEALEETFRDWWSRNSFALDDGGCGDVLALFTALCATAKKS